MRWSLLFAAIVFLAGLLAQIAGLTGITILASLVPGWPLMAMSTGACFMCGALSIVLLARSERDSSQRVLLHWLVRGCGAIPLMVGGVVFGRYLLQQVSGDAPSAVSTTTGVMSPGTALAFVAVGTALVGTKGPRGMVTYQILCLISVLLGMFGVCRYLFGGVPLHALTAMSINTSLAFILVGLGLVASRPSGGLMAIMCSDTQGGALLRRFLPMVVIIPIALALLRLQGQRAGWYSLEGGLALATMANVTLFVAFVWIYAWRLHRTDLKRAQHEALSSQLAEVVQSSNDAIIGTTLDGNISSWNGSAERLFGYTAAEAVGMPILRLMQEADRATEGELLALVAIGRVVENRDVVRVHKDGRSLDIAQTLSPIRDAAGVLIGTSTIARDISEKKRVERRLHQQLAHLDLLRQVTRAVSERQDLSSIYQAVVRCLEEQVVVDFACICLYDRNAHTLTVSRIGSRSATFAIELALKEQAVIEVGRNGLSRCIQGELVYEADLASIDAPFPRRLQGVGLRSLVAAPLQVESLVIGLLLVARRQANAFSSSECEFLSQLSDHVGLATRHAEVLGALQRAYDDLRQTQQAVMQHERLRALGQMASGIAHDINNSLTPLISYADLLLMRETGLSERGRHGLETIRRAGEDVAATVARLREFYRHQGPGSVSMVGGDINALVTQVMELTQPQWRAAALQRGVTITFATELGTDLPLILCIESELREALTNLVLNAVDAMPTGGTITVRTKQIETPMTPDGVPGGRALQVEVCDAGTGMDEQTRKRCLEPFFTTKGERGTGLGLAMVFGIVQRHGAELAIDSVVGQGTTFRLTFFNFAATSRPSVMELVSMPPRMRLLLVDDDPIILKALSDFLTDEGHEVTIANGGKAGIEAFLASYATPTPFELVITDLGMPQVDGRKVAEAVKAASPTTPVIMLTGWGQRLQEGDQRPANVDLLLSKPPKMHEIRAALIQLGGQPRV